MSLGFKRLTLFSTDSLRAPLQRSVSGTLDVVYCIMSARLYLMSLCPLQFIQCHLRWVSTYIDMAGTQAYGRKEVTSFERNHFSLSWEDALQDLPSDFSCSVCTDL